jgi:2-hydroxychromene-2-carboxylate isomerase
MTDVDFIFDFASPNAYFAHQIIPGIESRTGATFRYIPCLLGGIFKATGNQAPMITFSNVKGKLEYDQLEIQRFITKHQISRFQFNTNFPVNTLLLMRGAIVAEMDGALPQYIEAAFGHMWEEGLKMDDPDVYVAAMNSAGFDGKHLFEQTQNAEVKARLVANTAAAVERGSFGIPTFYLGSEMYFGKDRLRDIEEALAVAEE